MSNVAMLLDCLKEHEVTTHLWTWDSPAAREVSHQFHSAHLNPEPQGVNSYKQFWTLKLATTSSTADFVIQSRTDMTIQVDIKDWLNPGCYTTIHVRGDFPGNPNSEFINDQFGVATPEIMRRAWDYANEETLKKFMSDAQKPEDVFQSILDMNHVPVIIAPTAVWVLDKNRHGELDKA